MDGSSAGIFFALRKNCEARGFYLFLYEMIPMADNLSIPIQISFAQLLDAVDQLSKAEQHQLLLHVLRRHEEDNLIVTHFASETVLAKDWNNSIEDEVWRDL